MNTFYTLEQYSSGKPTEYYEGSYGQGPKVPHRDPKGSLIQLTTVSIKDAHCSLVQSPSGSSLNNLIQIMFV